MHELHKGSEKFQIYVVFNAIWGLGLRDSNAWAPQGKWGVPNLWNIFLISNVHLISSPIDPSEDFVLIEKMYPSERQVAMHT